MPDHPQTYFSAEYSISNCPNCL